MSANMKTEDDELYSRKDTMFSTDEKRMSSWRLGSHSKRKRMLRTGNLQRKSFSSGRFCCDSWNLFAAPDKRPHDEPDQANHNQYSRISRSEHARYFL